MSTSEESAAAEPVATPRIRGVATVFGLSYNNFRGPTQNFGQKLQFFFLLKKNPQVCGKFVPKYEGAMSNRTPPIGG